MTVFGFLGDWVAERIRDLARWPVNLIRDGPRRVRRFRLVAAPNHSMRWRLHALACALFDLFGGPEIAQFLMHLAMHTSPLEKDEIAVASSILGPQAMHYDNVRIARGGILRLVFHWNGGRAFATWHSVHLPEVCHRTRGNLGLLVHELTHVYQYEQVGSRYIGEALIAQRRQGKACYRYGGAAGLATAREKGRLFHSFNREAQAQIAQDYYLRRLAEKDLAAYTPFIEELRDGAC